MLAQLSGMGFAKAMRLLLQGLDCMEAMSSEAFIIWCYFSEEVWLNAN